METNDIISLTGIIIGFIVVIVNIILAGRVRRIVLNAEERFKQSSKVSDKAIVAIQEINFCLRKLKEVYIGIHLRIYLVKENDIEVIKDCTPVLDRFQDKFIDSFSRGEIFLNKTLREKLYGIDYSLKHPSSDEIKLKRIISDIEIVIDEICDLTKDIYFPFAKYLIDK